MKKIPSKVTKKTKEEIEENRINDTKIIGRIIYEKKDGKYIFKKYRTLNENVIKVIQSFL